MESGQAHAPQQAEQEAETPQDKIETEEGGEAQNQQDQGKDGSGKQGKACQPL